MRFQDFDDPVYKHLRLRMRQEKAPPAFSKRKVGLRKNTGDKGI